MPGAGYKRPESVLVLVAARTGEVLLLTRAEPAGYRQSVTGSLEPGETPRAAARRELAEETGLTGHAIEDLQVGARFPIHPAWRPRFAPEVRENREHWFRLCLDSPEPARPGPEHVAARWVPVEEAVRSVASWSNRVAIQRYACLPDSRVNPSPRT